MVLLDRADAFRAVTASKDDAQPSESPLIPVITDRAEQADSASVSAMEWRRSAASATHRVREFDWMAASPAPLQGTHGNEQPASWERGGNERHIFRRTAEDGGAHRDETDRIAEILHQRAQTRSAVAVGRSNALGFAAGETFTLDGHPGEGLDGTYLLTSVTHRADCPEVDVRGSGLAGPNYENRFQAIDARTPYRPEGRPSPRAYGQQTATVIGPPGEEIHTDVHGRIQVWMHWDPNGPDQGLDRACWLRVAQPMAGPGFGTMFLPRVGMEVLVSFVDGDPDRPVCVGCLYGGANTTPYALPDDRTKTTIKTRSSPGGDGFNELRFEDAAGGEQVYLHAQRNLDEEVLAAHTMDVGSTQSVSVGSDQTIKVGGGRDIKVKGTQSIQIDGASTAVPPGPALKQSVVGDIETITTTKSQLIAPQGIQLICGATVFEMTPEGITMVAGKGSMLKLDAAVLVAAAGGAVQMAMGADGKAGLVSASGAAMEVDTTVKMSSMAGAQLQLSKELEATAPGGASLQLSKDARLQGGTAAVEGSGARIKLDRNADLYGAEVHAHSKNGSVRADAAGVQVQGADTKLVGTLVATVQAPIVKVN